MLGEIIPPEPEEVGERQAQVIRRAAENPILPPGSRRGRIVAISTGPLPPPSVLVEYERAMPGLAKRIVGAFEDENRYRRDQDALDRQTNRDIARQESLYQGLGMRCAAFVSTVGFIAAATVAAFGHGGAAGLIATVDLVGLASVFIIGRRVRDEKPESDDGG